MPDRSDVTSSAPASPIPQVDSGEFEALVSGPTRADDLSDLWDGEGCGWSAEYRGGDGAWVVVLRWQTDYEVPHDALWYVLTWEFYGDTLDEALTDAIDWCWSLHWLERCPECDGLGAWNGVECETCRTTGLRNLPANGRGQA